MYDTWVIAFPCRLSTAQCWLALTIRQAISTFSRPQWVSKPRQGTSESTASQTVRSNRMCLCNHACAMQVGEAEVTLEVGREALLHKKAAPYRRDILLAMALASCGLASSALAQEQVPPQPADVLPMRRREVFGTQTAVVCLLQARDAGHLLLPVYRREKLLAVAHDSSGPAFSALAQQ